MNNLRFAKSIFTGLLALFIFVGFNSCKHLVNEVTPPSLSGVSIGGSEKSILAPTDLVASNGLKQKISLSWTEVPGAKHYFIYHSENPTTDFSLVGESDTNTYDDAVSAGKTAYYKVKAVKADGTSSDFTSIVKGTSLAVPVLSGEEVTDETITLYWYMENARDVRQDVSNYEDDLRYKVVCENQITGKTYEKILQGNEYEYMFDFLDGATPYYYYVSAYLESFPNDEESSPKVTKSTLTAYTPRPPEFTASEGSASNKITLKIKLPQKVFVNTYTDSSSKEKVDVEYPVYFVVERKESAQNESEYITVENHLFFDGKPGTYDEPNKQYVYTSDNTVPEYRDGDNDLYEEGDEIEWSDTDTNLKKGVLYDYRIRSFVDTNYSAIITTEESKRYKATIGSRRSTLATGWVCNTPKFNVTNPVYTKEGNINTAVEFGFTASWESLGKAADYRFAIRREIEDELGGKTYSWLEDGRTYETLKEIESLKRHFDISDSNKGVYRYALYIFPKSILTAADDNMDKALVSCKATRVVSVVEDTTPPEPKFVENNESVSGWKNKIQINFVCESDKVNYVLIRNKGMADEYRIEDIEVEGVADNEPVVYEDTGLEPGTEYTYVLEATRNGVTALSPEPISARTLGVPEPVFSVESLSYDTITVTFNKVLAAEKYKLTLGTTDAFGDGKTAEITEGTFDKTGDLPASITADGDNYTVTIEKPAGYDDAKKAGAKVALKVEAVAKESAESSVEVNVLGPSSVVVTPSDPENDKLVISWPEVAGAQGYTITRKSQSVEDTCTVKNVNGEWVVEGRPEGSATIELKSIGFEFTDKPKNAADATATETLQSKIELGYDYEYTVLPIRFDSENNIIANDISYSNLGDKAKRTSTYGFGNALNASKAASADQIVLTWTPTETQKGYASGTQMKVFRRPSSDTNAVWTKVSDDEITFDETARNKVTVKFKNGDALIDSDPNGTYYKPYDYIVQYGASASCRTLPKAFVDAIYELDSSSGEPKCKGYTFTLNTYTSVIEKFKAGHSGGYAEYVEWSDDIYDASKKVRPDSIEIQVLNKNFSSGWKKLISIDPTTLKISAAVGAVSGVTDVSYAVGGTYKALFNPTSVTSASSAATTGLLKVLRDYKHYYRIVAKKGEMTSVIGDDQSVYGYREISQPELAKCVSLIIADALMQAGINSTEGKSTSCTGQTGTFTFQHKKNKNLTWGTGGSDYVHKFKSGVPYDKTNEMVSFLKISIADVGANNSVTYNDVSKFCEATIKVNNTISTSLSSCTNKYISFAAGGDISAIFVGTHNGSHNDYRKVTIYCGDSVTADELKTAANLLVNITTSSADNDFDKWFPCPIGKTFKNTVTSYTAYTDDNRFYQYQSPWWD